MAKIRLLAIGLIVFGILVAYFSFAPMSAKPGFLKAFPLQLGLDLSGGTQLTYKADVSKLDPSEVDASMAALRDVIERRVNLFGVSEPVVQVERGSLVAGTANQQRLLVELPGITDVDQAVALIGKTPVLEFKLENPKFVAAQSTSTTASSSETGSTTADGLSFSLTPNAPQTPHVASTSASSSAVSSSTVTSTASTSIPQYLATGLTGRYLTGASLQFNQVSGSPIVALKFNSQGSKLFEQITGNNIGKVLAIFLDGAPISTPVINEKITGGQAVIEGNFTPQEARTLVGRLNAGALPVPIQLLSSETVGATLGGKAFNDGITAGIIAFLLVAFFMLLWYRLPGLVAVFALAFYAAATVAFFRLIPVTLTAAGIAGFILSIGMAVDANILIFERLKEEMRKGKTLHDATHEGFLRAWPSIRDSHLSSIITAIVLFWLGTSIVKGFALVFGLGVVVSLFSAVTLTRILLFAIGLSDRETSPTAKFLFGSGFHFKKKRTES
ncbi:MAG TPA: protein translocase subunit SecD [Candidatus Paceibacterota bacterium]|nr:protein translocase subunit SecD [Candidatus Paceibacterota bacterium]